MAYSTGVWRLINDYFRQEFRTFLDEEVKKNKYLMVDPNSEAVSESPPVEIISESEVRQAQSSVTANRLLDEMILSFGRLFTAGNRVKTSSRRQASGQPTANEILTPTGTDAPGTVSSDSVQTGSKSHPNPGTLIEADKFRRSSSAEWKDNKAKSSDDCDAANDDSNGDGDDDDDEQKWIRYWKNREKSGQSSSGEVGSDESYCQAAVDTCG